MKFVIVENSLLLEDTIVGVIFWDDGDVYVSASNESTLGVFKVFLDKNREIRVNLKDLKDEKSTRSRVLTLEDEEWLSQIKPKIPSPFSITKIGEVSEENNFASALGKIKKSFRINWKDEKLEKVI